MQPCPNFVVVPVLNNDVPLANIDRSSVYVESAAGHGTTTVNPDGSIAYAPDCGFGGVDTFTYHVCGLNSTDSGGSCGTAIVNIVVTLKAVDTFIVRTQLPVNTSDDQRIITINVLPNISADITYLFVPNTGFLVLIPPLNGTVTGDSSGLFYYTPDATFAGDDFFTYKVCTDPSCSITVTATVHIRILIIATNQYYEVYQVHTSSCLSFFVFVLNV